MTQQPKKFSPKAYKMNVLYMGTIQSILKTLEMFTDEDLGAEIFTSWI